MSNQEDTLDNQYFSWLYGQLGAVDNRNPARSYWSLARQLYVKRFDWSVLNDDNRESDGIELREEFITASQQYDVDQSWMTLECSMLEMLLGLSRRASYESLNEPLEWFWRFMQNLGLHHWSDKNYGTQARREVDEALERVIYRTYQQNGDGGLFPLRNAETDQRKVELWYQLMEYLHEGDFYSHGL